MAGSKLGRFGWDGIGMNLPEGWQPCFIEYQQKQIMMRFEDERNAERLQLKVQDIKGRFAVDRNMKAIEKGIRKARKKSPDLEFRTGVTIPMVKKTFRGEPFATFGWREGDLVAWGLLVHCPKCARASIIQIVSGADEDDPQLAGRILSSYRDHPEGDIVRWSAYGVDFDAPRSFTHAEHGYDPRGLFRVTLKDGRESLSVLRWNLANLMLKGTDLEGFARKSFTKDFRRYNLAVEYDTTRLISRMKVAFRRRLRSLRPAFMCGMLWHCAATNRIFSVHLLSDSSEESERLRELASHLRCCPGAEGAGGGGGAGVGVGVGEEE